MGSTEKSSELDQNLEEEDVLGSLPARAEAASIRHVGAQSVGNTYSSLYIARRLRTC
jgi:hypothetical protein